MESGLGNGCGVDAVDGFLQNAVELGIALPCAQILGERAGEAGDEPVVAGELLICLVLRIAAAEGNDADDVRILHELFVEVVLSRDRDLEHDLGVCRQFCKVLLHETDHDLLRFCLLGTVDVHLGLEDGDEPFAEDLHTDFKLLVDDGFDARLVCLFDDGAHLRAEDVALVRAVEQGVESVDGLHELDAVLLVGQSLVHLEDGDDALFLPQEICGEDTVDLAVHCILKENRGEDFFFVKRRALDDARAHLVDAREHLLFTVVGALVNAVCLQRLGGRAAALVEGCDETFVVLHPLELILIHWACLLFSNIYIIAQEWKKFNEIENKFHGIV